MMKAYVSGPVSGLPGDNEAAFRACAERLRALGIEPLVPHDIVPKGCDGWHEAMRHRLAFLPSCDAAVFLPGWQSSRGAKVERIVAMACGLPCVEANDIERKWGL